MRERVTVVALPLCVCTVSVLSLCQSLFDFGEGAIFRVERVEPFTKAHSLRVVAGLQRLQLTRTKYICKYVCFPFQQIST